MTRMAMNPWNQPGQIAGNPYSGIASPSYAMPTVQDVGAPPSGSFTMDPGTGLPVGQSQAYTDWAQRGVDMQKAAGFNPDGSPISPEFQSNIDQNTGFMKGPWEAQAGSLDPSNVGGWNQFEKFATGVGPSEYAMEAQKGLDLKTAMGRDRATKEAATAGAQARSQLAMRGGLGGGARERIASGAALGGLGARQDTRQAQLMGGADISIQDAMSRQGALQDFTRLGIGVEEGNLARGQQTQQFNIQNAMNEMQKQRDFQMDKYLQEGKKWAAGKKAASEERIAKEGSGCWLISGLAKHIDFPAEEGDLMTQFKKYMLITDPRYAMFYMFKCKPLVEKMNAAEFDWKGFKWFNDAIVVMLRNGEFESAFKLWKATVFDLITEYWSDCEEKTFLRMKKTRNETVKEASKEITLPKRFLKFAGHCASHWEVFPAKPEAI